MTPTKPTIYMQGLAKQFPIDSNLNLVTNVARTANSVYVAIAGEVVNRRSVRLINVVLNGKESASSPLLHIHVNVSGHCRATPKLTDVPFDF